MKHRLAKLRQKYRRVAGGAVVVGALLAIADAPVIGIILVLTGFAAILADAHATHDSRTSWGEE